MRDDDAQLQELLDQIDERVYFSTDFVRINSILTNVHWDELVASIKDIFVRKNSLDPFHNHYCTLIIYDLEHVSHLIYKIQAELDYHKTRWFSAYRSPDCDQHVFNIGALVNSIKLNITSIDALLKQQE